MSTEAEKRLHRCCFSGHRPEKLDAPEEAVKGWLRKQIAAAVSAGYTTFLCGMGMGADIWAGEIVLAMREKNPRIRLVCAVPWPAFSNRWSVEWHERYSRLLKAADLSVVISHQYRDDVFRKRNEWLADHASRLIAYYNGEPGGTREMIAYAREKGLEVITNDPPEAPAEGGKLRERGEKNYDSVWQAPGDAQAKKPYPENIVSALGLGAVFGKEEYAPLNPDQLAGLEHVLGTLPAREREILDMRYRKGMTLQECGINTGISRQRVNQIEQRALKKLRHPYQLVYIRDGLEKTETMLKIACAEEMKRCLIEQKKRYPQMTEEDVVKFAFQGMLGVGHLVRSEEDALAWLKKEMDAVEPDMEEPLAEKISSYWLRVNLRAAKARGKTAEELAYQMFRSAKMKPVSFTRQNVYNFCVKLDGSEKMKAAAEKVLDESWLPSHSLKYREAYHPAYRVMYKDYRKFRREDAAESGEEAQEK